MPRIQIQHPTISVETKMFTRPQVTRHTPRKEKSNTPFLEIKEKVALEERANSSAQRHIYNIAYTMANVHLSWLFFSREIRTGWRTRRGWEWRRTWGQPGARRPSSPRPPATTLTIRRSPPMGTYLYYISSPRLALSALYSFLVLYST